VLQCKAKRGLNQAANQQDEKKETQDSIEVVNTE
jgi:hypothetical protein